MIVQHGQVPRLKDGAPALWVYLDAVRGHRLCPEPTIGSDAGVEVVYLTRLAKYVQSDEPKRAVALATILVNIRADHEAHIDFPVQTLSLMGYEVVVGALPTDIGEANESFEVRDSGRVVRGRVGIKAGIG